MNSARLLLPCFVVIALALNLLLPIHAQGYFFSLAVGEAVYNNGAFLERNIFTELGFGEPWASPSPAFDLVVFLLEKTFGEMGSAVLQVVLFLLIAGAGLLVALRVNHESSDTLANYSVRVPVVTMWALIFTGTVLYGVSLDSRLFFLASLLYTVLFLLFGAGSGLMVNMLRALPLGVLLLFDIRTFLVPLCALAVLYLGRFRDIKLLLKSALGLQAFLFILVAGLSFLRNGLVSYVYSLKVEFLLSRMLHPDMFSIRFAVEQGYFGYSMAFFLLLLILFAIRIYEEKKPPGIIPAFLLLIALVGSMISPTMRYIVASGFLCFLSRGYSGEHDLSPNSKMLRIENTINRLALFFSRLSYSGRVFVLFAFSFVQLAGFIKYPVTDLLLPAKNIDAALEAGICPELNPIRSGGYQVYRMQHRSECKPACTIFTLGSLRDEETGILLKRRICAGGICPASSDTASEND